MISAGWLTNLRRPLRFSVRTVMLLMIVFSGWVGWVSHRARVQRRAVAAVYKAGGAVTYDFQQQQPDGRYTPEVNPRTPRSLRPFVGDEPFQEVVGVTFSGDYVTSESLKPLREFTRLERLIATYSRVSDAGLEHIAALPCMTHLELAYSRVGDAGLAHLAGLTRLEHLGLTATPVTDAGMARLSHLSNLQTLCLADTSVGNSGLEPIKRLRELRELSLSGTRVDDTGAARLVVLKKLRLLHVFRTSVSDRAVADLRKSLPELNRFSAMMGLY